MESTGWAWVDFFSEGGPGPGRAGPGQPQSSQPLHDNLSPCPGVLVIFPNRQSLPFKDRLKRRSNPNTGFLHLWISVVPPLCHHCTLSVIPYRKCKIKLKKIIAMTVARVKCNRHKVQHLCDSAGGTCFQEVLHKTQLIVLF